MIDADKTRTRIARAVALAGPRPWLLGYDANGIQELVTASSRPIAMFGASATIALFDESSQRDSTIFAGGGRGVELVASEEAARARAGELAFAFRKETWGGVMATACVPYDPAAPAQSLRWLRRKLEIQKDAALPPGGAIPTTKNDICADCGTYLARHKSTRPDWQGEMVCDRCDAMANAGRDRSRHIDERIQSLVDLSPTTGPIAAVSVDGNDLGDFFDKLESLEQMAIASEAISLVFERGNEAARLKLQHPKVSLATGGDDIRLFLAWDDLLRYVSALVPAIEREADALARQGPPFDRLAGLGIGIGAVVADARLPASRLMTVAHELERKAKRLCRPSSPGKSQGPRVRSAFDFAVLTAGDASYRATEEKADGKPNDDLRPIDMAAESWSRLLHAVEALARIPTAQRAILAEIATLGEEEGSNLLRYQVARSKKDEKWRAWYAACGVDWRDPDAVWRHRPRPVHLDLVRLLPRESA
ncbi:hypothetical protein [Polyangium sp. 15x6]|uniref:Cas10/Cmr2 second palm domain-containing protein n=1 Tax=Polyangium sp. 15x6 TaxID=3042687 RepID=UPI00249BE5E1|nr:hypothetical protein [Polyangium sp. 15x6]MDI3290990.1 hypothetical protein [Polyangium sp. 15x6]